MVPALAAPEAVLTVLGVLAYNLKRDIPSVYNYIGRTLLERGIERHRASIEAFRRYEPIVTIPHNHAFFRGIAHFLHAADTSESIRQRIQKIEAPEPPEFSAKQPTLKRLKNHIGKVIGVFDTPMPQKIYRTVMYTIKKSAQHGIEEKSKATLRVLLGSQGLIAKRASQANADVDYATPDSPETSTDLADNGTDANSLDTYMQSGVQVDIFATAHKDVAARHVMDRQIYGHTANIDLDEIKQEDALQAAADSFGETIQSVVDSGLDVIDHLPLFSMYNTYDSISSINRREEELRNRGWATQAESDLYGDREIWAVQGSKWAGKTTGLILTAGLDAGTLGSWLGGVFGRYIGNDINRSYLNAELQSFQTAYTNAHYSAKISLCADQELMAEAVTAKARSEVNRYIRNAKISCPDFKDKKNVRALAYGMANAYVADYRQAQTVLDRTYHSHIRQIERPRLYHRFFNADWRTQVNAAFREAWTAKSMECETRIAELAKFKKRGDPVLTLEFIASQPVIRDGQSEKCSTQFPHMVSRVIDSYKDDIKNWRIQIDQDWNKAAMRTSKKITTELNILRTAFAETAEFLKSKKEKIQAHLVRLGADPDIVNDI